MSKGKRSHKVMTVREYWEDMNVDEARIWLVKMFGYDDKLCDLLVCISFDKLPEEVKESLKDDLE